MDRLKYIKLENEDGSYSSSIPLSVDGYHVDIDGNTLIDTLDKKASIVNTDLSINNLQSQINNLANGGPLVATSVAEMTNTSKTYVNTTDGHWYYHNGTAWLDGGIYQATEISDNSISTTMLQNNSITYEKLGDYNLKAIEDYFSEGDNFSFDIEKITSSTSTDLQKGNLTDYEGGINVWAISFPFTYDETKQYKYLIIPQLKIVHDGYLHITLGTTPSNQIQSSTFRNSIINETKRYFFVGDYTNVVIPLFNYDYSGMTSESVYYLSLFELSNETSPTYSSLYQFEITNNTSPNANSSFISDIAAMKMIQGYGSWSWATFSGSTWRGLVPAVGLTIENPLKFDMDLNSLENKLKGKKINFLGDSITQGVDGSTNGQVASYPYPLIIANKTGATCRNYGIAGSTIGGDGTTVSEVTQAIMGFQPMHSRIANLNTDVDYNVVFGGINDATADRKVPLGELGDTTSLTFYGALDIIAKYMLEHFPTKKNAFITPPRNKSENNDNPFGVKVKDYVDAVVAVGNKYGIPVLNMYNNFGGTPTNSIWKNANMPDGVHPNQSYYYDIADKISAFLETL